MKPKGPPKKRRKLETSKPCSETIPESTLPKSSLLQSEKGFQSLQRILTYKDFEYLTNIGDFSLL